MDYLYLDSNIEKIKKRIGAAAERCGRNADEITFLAAIKSADVGEINYIHSALGIREVGENRVQQLLERYDKLDGVGKGLKMHFIGSLQTNKVKYIIDKVDLIHSLDSDRLAAEIDKQARKKDLVANVLVEINSGNEESKGGIEPGQAAEFCLALAKYKNIKLCGFMTMAPRCENKSDYYGYFKAVKKLSDKIWHDVLCLDGEPVISMGMSESFEEAIECGATMVRVGRQCFAKD
ncbi:MAG: YggS family pyridoxal phosphate-dependent enzyme [Clostridia bacterium]|nr:YggS family pyridoxal phosphate-dependent enzyme [Clostridia bacterium]